MASGITIALFAALAFGILGISLEIAGKRGYPPWDFVFWKQSIGLAIACGLAGYASSGPWWQPRLAALACIGAASYVLAITAYLRAARQRDIAANWTIANLSVVVPILVSVLWFGDSFGAGKAAGVALTVVSIVLIGGGFESVGRAARAAWARDILLAFFFNGWFPVVLRLVPEGQTELFTVYFFAASIPMVVACKLAARTRWDVSGGLLATALLGGASHMGGSLLTMLALQAAGPASQQAGVIVYSITNGLVIPVGVLLGWLLLAQVPSPRGGLGVVLGGIALLLFCIA